MQQSHINVAHLAYYWKLFTHLIHTKEIHVLTCFPIAGVMLTERDTDRTMGTSVLNPGAEFIRIFTVAFDRLVKC